MLYRKCGVIFNFTIKNDKKPKSKIDINTILPINSIIFNFISNPKTPPYSWLSIKYEQNNDSQTVNRSDKIVRSKILLIPLLKVNDKPIKKIKTGKNKLPIPKPL